MLKRWTKLIQGLRIRQRLIEQYADRNLPTASASSSKTGTAKADSHARDDDAGVDNQPPDEVRVLLRFCRSVTFFCLMSLPRTPHACPVRPCHCGPTT